MRELKYTKGMAMIVLEERESASEYHSESFLEVQFNFKSIAAIKRLVDELGYHIISKEEKEYLIKEKRRRDIVQTTCAISFQEIPFGQPLWYTKRGFQFEYTNHYTDEHYRLRIPVTKDDLKNCLKNDEFKRLYKNASCGSCANGGSLRGYIDSLIRSKNVIK